MVMRVMLCLVLLCIVTGFAMAQEEVDISCNKCDLHSNGLWNGLSHGAGVDYVLVYCDKCKNFHTVLAGIEGRANVSGKKIQNPIGKENFFGAVRDIYLCPICNSKSFDFSWMVNGDKCPDCGEGTLQKHVLVQHD